MSEVDRLLLIDDDPILLRVCAEWLHREGYEVVTALNGQEGLNLLAQQPFSAAVVDIVLPDTDGLSILKAIKESHPDVVVLLVTGHASLDTAIEALRTGAYDYLRKPFSNHDLARVVRHGLDQRRLALANRHLLRELDSINRDLLERVSLATDELAAFVGLGREFERAGTPLAMLEQVLSAATQLAGAAHGAVVQRHADGRTVCLAALGARAGELRALALADEHLVAEAVAGERPVLQSHLLHDPATAAGPLALAGFTSALIVPLLGLSGTTGALVLLDGDKGFSDRQANLVKVMAAHAAEIVPAVAAPPATASDEFVDLQDLLGRKE